VIAHDSPDDAVAKRLEKIDGVQASTGEPDHDQRAALCRWGIQMYSRRGLPDPFVDPTELTIASVL
jgi:hypothetical protein